VKRRSKYSIHDTSQRVRDGKPARPTSGERPFMVNRDGITCPVVVSKFTSPGQQAKFDDRS
jgi:hypothetical protein